jgi:acetyl esterase/lipase
VAKATGCRALIVDYRRAPENIHPGPVNDMVRSYKWLLDQDIQPGHVALIGDSAGGGLAVTTSLRAREQGLPLLAATMPLSPWLDMKATGETFETNTARTFSSRATSSRPWLECSSAKLATARTRSQIRCVPTSRIEEMRKVNRRKTQKAAHRRSAVRCLLARYSWPRYFVPVLGNRCGG